MNQMDDPWRQDELKARSSRSRKRRLRPDGLQAGAAGCFGLLVLFCLVAGASIKRPRQSWARLYQMEEKAGQAGQEVGRDEQKSRQVSGRGQSVFEDFMQIGSVVGHAVSTVKHPSLKGWRLLVVQLLMADGKPDGEPLLAIDALAPALVRGWS